MGESVAVVGCGHVGLVTAAGLADLGHDVVGIDIDQELIRELNAGAVRLHEPGLGAMVERGRARGHLRFVSEYAAAIPDARFVFLAVDTPQGYAGAADLRNLRAAVTSIALALGSTNPIIVNKSTSPIGTGETIEEMLRTSFTERPVRVVSNPEFLRQGSAVDDFRRPERIVLGAREPEEAWAVAELYAGLPGARIITDLRTAETIKYVANAFLATRVSFANEVARLCEGLGSDVQTVMDGAGADPRVGRHYLHPGIGYGGSCLPKDVAALRYLGETAGVTTPLLGAVQEVNAAARTGVIRRLRAALGHLEGRRIAVWGLTFKGGTEDTRESPAVDAAALLRNEGADIVAYDPAVAEDRDRAPEWLRPLCRYGELEAAEGADAVAVLTDWDRFRTIEAADVASVMYGNVVYDGRNVLDPAGYRRAGLLYLGVGRGDHA